MTTGHLVHECEQAIAAALDKADGVEFCYLSPADKAASLVALQRSCSAAITTTAPTTTGSNTTGCPTATSASTGGPRPNETGAWLSRA